MDVPSDAPAGNIKRVVLEDNAIMVDDENELLTYLKLDRRHH